MTAPNQNIKLTEAEQLKQTIFREIAKCTKSYEYCLETYGKIPVPGQGNIPFALREYQKKCLRVFEKKEDTIILKSRQLGLSTLVAGFIACGMIFEENYNALVVATKKDVAINLVKKVRVALKNFPSWLMTEKIYKDNAMSLELTNGSFVKAVPSSDDAGRSEALSLLVIDEAAHISNVDTIWTGASETLSESGGQAIVISTPNGVGNWYHKKWIDADEGVNNFYPIRLDWWVHPERDEAWKAERIKSSSEREFEQEHGCSFLATGNTLIKGWKIKELIEKTIEPLYKSKEEENFWVWKKPEENKNYLISVDTADGGDDGDFSAAHIIELEECEQVAEFKGYINPGKFGKLLIKWAKAYNNALLVIERNNLGPAVIQPALDEFYENLFYSRRGSLDFVDPNMNNGNLEKDLDKNNAGVKPGFITTIKTRPLVIQKISDFINDDCIIIKSKRTTSELLTFININGKYQAMSSYHDDLIMALGIGLFIRDTAIKLRKLANDIDNTRLDLILENNQNFKKTVNCTKNKAIENDFNLIYTNSNTENPYKQKMGNNYEFDMRELLN